MFSDVISHLIYSFLNAPIREYPYPHFLSADVFPKNFYDEIMNNMQPSKKVSMNVKSTNRLK
jgi:hypothetical protein